VDREETTRGRRDRVQKSRQRPIRRLRTRYRAWGSGDRYRTQKGERRKRTLKMGLKRDLIVPGKI